MIKLAYTEATGLGYRHRTWTKIGESAHRLSALQNQFALWEYELSEEEALKWFRVWLWHELQDKYNVVSTEMRRLARAHKREEEVEILVPKDAAHGAMIVRALLWLADNADLSEPVQTRWTEPGPTYEPILPDGAITTKAEIDPKYIVWIEGNTQCRIGVVVAYGQAFVPEYGIVPMKRFRWVNRKLAQLPKLQQLLNDAFDQAFEAEEGSEPVEYEPAPSYVTSERYDDAGWFYEQTLEENVEGSTALAVAEQDATSLVEQLIEEVGDLEVAVAVAQTPDIEDWYFKAPPLPSYVQAETIRPVYKHKGENSPLSVKSVEEQLEGKPFRYAAKREAQYYLHTHGKVMSKAGNTRKNM